MSVDVRIPELGESISEATLVRWLKADGDRVEADEPVLEIETEKAAMEIAAAGAGRLQILEAPGARLRPGAVVGRITADAASAEPAPRAPAPPVPAPPVPAPPAPAAPPPDRPAAPEPRRPPAVATADGDNGHGRRAEADVERVPMSALRRTIATRLVEAQRTAAILTTFNEVDLGELLALRARHRERFRARHGVDLGLVALFGRAVLQALRDHPVLNASIDGDTIVYHRRVHLGVAVSTPRGLVVPVVRDADRCSIADLGRAIDRLAQRAREARLSPEELAEGTFTITNGGVFGSLLSTPILNPPQSGILGMHKIEERPVAIGGQVVIRPMMYVALSYDHRLVDGEQAVRFLVGVKAQLEDPARMVLEV